MYVYFINKEILTYFQNCLISTITVCVELAIQAIFHFGTTYWWRGPLTPNSTGDPGKLFKSSA